MLKKGATFIVTCFGILFLAKVFTFSTKDEAAKLAQQDFFAAKSHDLDPNSNFCGEVVPIHAEDIYERLDKEIHKNGFWHSEIILYHKRAGKYFPIIEPILKQHKIPNDFKYLAVIESGLSNVRSPAGAAGFWQIMEKTGKELGLEINNEVDERYHLEKATHAACKYLQESYDKFGSWTLVAASYNMGRAGVARSMKQQKVNNYYDLLLNSETARYVFRIVAIKSILETPARYGFHLEARHKYPPIHYKTIENDSSIANLTDFAIENGINYKLLKLANPWLREQKMTNSKRKNYIYKIPTENYYIFSEYNCEKNGDSTMTDSMRVLLCGDSLSKTPLDSLKKTLNSDSIENPLSE